MLAAWCAAAALAAPVEAQSWRTVTSARQAWDKMPLDVKVEYGAGELRLEPATAPLLYQLEMRYDEDAFSPITDYDAEARRLRLGVRSHDRRGGVNLDEGSRATLALARDVPLTLDLEFGAGQADLDLGGMSLRRLNLSTGASETHIRFGSPNAIPAEAINIEAGAAEVEVVGLGNARAARYTFQGGVGSTLLDFTGTWSADAHASVKMGIGSIRLRFPRGLGVRLNKSSFLTSFDSEGLVKRGSSYYSPDWDTARHRLSIDVEAAFGSVEVEWVDAT